MVAHPTLWTCARSVSEPAAAPAREVLFTSTSPSVRLEGPSRARMIKERHGNTDGREPDR